MALAVLPVIAVIGGWKLLSRDHKAPTPQATSTDDPSVVVPTDSPSPSPTPTSPSGKSAKPALQILNGTRDSSLLTSAEQKLKGAGYAISTTSEASRRYPKTTVFYQDGFVDQAKELATLVGATITSPAPENLDKQIPLAVVLGADYKP